MLRQTDIASHQLTALHAARQMAPALKRPCFSGIWAPIVTPFRDGEIDHDALGLLAQSLIHKGVSGLVVAGTTGEIESLSLRERLNAVRSVITATEGRIPVLVGIRNGDATSSGREIAQFDLPVAGFLLPLPDMPATAGRICERRLVDHFLTAADATDLPLILVDRHSRSGQGLTPRIMETLHRSGRFPAVVLDGRAAELLPELAELNGPQILCGSEPWLFITLQIGGHGGILPLANLVPEALVGTHDLFMAGQHDAAWQLYRSLRGLSERFSGAARVSALKTALAMDYPITPEIRAPETSVDLSASLRIRSELQAFRSGIRAA